MKKLYNFINRLLITSLITITTLILCKKNTKIKEYIKNNIFGINLNFASINNTYKKYFGTNIPFKELIEKEKTVFNEKIEYESKENYQEGVKLKVKEDYFVPALEDGIVVYIGEKEKYGNVVIINTKEGIDVWYGNLTNIGVNLYDYISKGELIGNSKEYLYLVFKKNGTIEDYEKYI